MENVFTTNCLFAVQNKLFISYRHLSFIFYIQFGGIEWRQKHRLHELRSAAASCKSDGGGDGYRKEKRGNPFKKNNRSSVAFSIVEELRRTDL